MKRILPPEKYRGLPCSIVAIGCAMSATSPKAVKLAKGIRFQQHGYLSLSGMERLLQANIPVKRCTLYAKGRRTTLRDYAHTHNARAVICVKGHYIYFDGRDYYSFLWNGGDKIVCVWQLE